MISLLWPVFAAPLCSVSSANLITIHYSSGSLGDGIKRYPEVQVNCVLLALSKTFAQQFFQSNYRWSSQRPSCRSPLRWVCRLLPLPITFCARDGHRIYPAPDSSFIVLSHTENQCLVCSAGHQGPGFFLAPRVCRRVNQFVSALTTPAR